jgi:ElaA protein
MVGQKFKMNLDGQWAHYSGLSVNDIHDLLAIRQAVFIVEQRSIYLDADEFDEYAHHFLVRHVCHSSSAEQAKAITPIVAYARLIPPEIKAQEVILGRILVAKNHRGEGLGLNLVKSCLDKCTALFPLCNIRLSAQCHLVDFYKKLGFEAVGKPYDDGGIEHIDMIFKR